MRRNNAKHKRNMKGLTNQRKGTNSNMIDQSENIEYTNQRTATLHLRWLFPKFSGEPHHRQKALCDVAVLF
jgi:hypothetical protein